jgi:hypothetical protein
MAYYERAMEAMTPRMEAALAGKAGNKTGFEQRVAAIMAVKFDYF